MKRTTSPGRIPCDGYDCPTLIVPGCETVTDAGRTLCPRCDSIETLVRRDEENQFRRRTDCEPPACDLFDAYGDAQRLSRRRSGDAVASGTLGWLLTLAGVVVVLACALVFGEILTR